MSYLKECLLEFMVSRSFRKKPEQTAEKAAVPWI